jgi:hypothetical protein
MDFDSSDRQLQAVDYEAIASIQNATEGKTVVVKGGSHTVEMLEIQRKMQTFHQLKLARKLRAVLESAVAEATVNGTAEGARQIFERNRSSMIELTFLTEAVRGRYIRENYNEGADAGTTKEDSRVCHGAQAILGDVRKRMAWENSESLRSRECREEQLMRQKAIERSAAKKKPEVRDTLDLNVVAKKKKLDSKLDTSTRQFKDSIQQVSNHQPKKKVTSIRSSKDQDQLLTQVQPKAKEVAPPGVYNRKSRRCHLCKEQKFDFMPCSYWHVTGKQCKKTFCLGCLKEIDGFSHLDHVKDGKDWHCPACLGKCNCPNCIRSRSRERSSREKERQASSHIRPSKRRFREE